MDLPEVMKQENELQEYSKKVKQKHNISLCYLGQNKK